MAKEELLCCRRFEDTGEVHRREAEISFRCEDEARDGQNKETNGKERNRRKEGSHREEGQKKKLQVVSELIEKVEGKLEQGELKATLADYVRLVQLQQDLEEGEAKEIKVTWVEPEMEKSDSEQ